MAEFRMPQLGADMTEGMLAQWLKQPGDVLHRGDVIAVVETDKGAIEVEFFDEAVLGQLLVAPGSTVPVGTVLAELIQNEGARPAPEKSLTGTAVAVPPAAIAVRPESHAESAPETPGSDRGLPRTQSAARTAASTRTKISPAAARLAAEQGVDITALHGTGPGGAIRIADVQTAPTRQPAAASAHNGAHARESAMRHAIALAMARSKREIPHYYLGSSIDMGVTMSWLAKSNAERPITERYLYGVLLIKAVALALRRFPEFNGFWRQDRFEPGKGIHIGVAVALRGGGLVAPAIHDVDNLPLPALMQALRDLVKRARGLRLRSSEMTDATITVTSLGDQGVDQVFGVIYPPQVALIGFGRPMERPWVTSPGVLGTRSVVQASLSGDHRANDGHKGALLLSSIERLLQEPEKL